MRLTTHDQTNNVSWVDVKVGEVGIESFESVLSNEALDGYVFPDSKTADRVVIYDWVSTRAPQQPNLTSHHVTSAGVRRVVLPEYSSGRLSRDVPEMGGIWG
jgi:hypothetical protein